MKTTKTRAKGERRLPFFLRLRPPARIVLAAASVLAGSTLITISTAPGFGYASPELKSAAPSGQKSSAQSQSAKSCLPGSTAPPCDSQCQPGYFVPRSAAKETGSHRWCETDPVTHRLTWDSDAPNVMNEFLVCRYNLARKVSEVYLDFAGGSITSTNTSKDDVGKGRLMLAVYGGSPAAALFKGQEVNLGKPSFSREWTKGEVTIPGMRVTVKFPAAVASCSVVLVGVDPSAQTKVAVRLDGLRVSSRPSVKKK